MWEAADGRKSAVGGERKVLWEVRGKGKVGVRQAEVE